MTATSLSRKYHPYWVKQLKSGCLVDFHVNVIPDLCIAGFKRFRLPSVQTFWLCVNSHCVLFQFYYPSETALQLMNFILMNCMVTHFWTIFVLHVDMRANSRVHLLSEAALIGLFHGSQPLESTALQYFQCQLATILQVLQCCVREVTFNSEEENYKGLFL